MLVKIIPSALLATFGHFVVKDLEWWMWNMDTVFTACILDPRCLVSSWLSSWAAPCCLSWSPSRSLAA